LPRYRARFLLGAGPTGHLASIGLMADRHCLRLSSLTPTPTTTTTTRPHSSLAHALGCCGTRTKKSRQPKMKCPQFMQLTSRYAYCSRCLKRAHGAVGTVIGLNAPPPAGQVRRLYSVSISTWIRHTGLLLHMRTNDDNGQWSHHGAPASHVHGHAAPTADGIETHRCDDEGSTQKGEAAATTFRKSK
jgi:hypothetical protein